MLNTSGEKANKLEQQIEVLKEQQKREYEKTEALTNLPLLASHRRFADLINQLAYLKIAGLEKLKFYKTDDSTSELTVADLSEGIRQIVEDVQKWVEDEEKGVDNKGLLEELRKYKSDKLVAYLQGKAISRGKVDPQSRSTMQDCVIACMSTEADEWRVRTVVNSGGKRDNNNMTAVRTKLKGL